MKKVEERLEELKQEYQSVPVPEDGRDRLRKAMEQAKEELNMNENNQKSTKRPAFLRRLGGIAAAVLILAALPNTNAQVARATGSLPVVGTFFRAVTVRNYTYEDDGASAQVEVPELKTNADSSAVEQVNADAAKYIDGLTEEFKSRVAESSGEANTDLTVSYEVVTDNEDWLTLRLYTEWVEASGAQYSRYYNIDKKQDKVVQLSDLFAEDSDALSLISENIKTQMREQMAADDSVSYFLDSDLPEDDFQQVKEDQNFRFDEEGNLVICFDEYEVAPGSMGLVEFTVARSVFEDALAAR
jgi:hypothetical protein